MSAYYIPHPVIDLRPALAGIEHREQPVAQEDDHQLVIVVRPGHAAAVAEMTKGTQRAAVPHRRAWFSWGRGQSTDIKTEGVAQLTLDEVVPAFEGECGGLLDGFNFEVLLPSVYTAVDQHVIEPGHIGAVLCRLAAGIKAVRSSGWLNNLITPSWSSAPE